MRKDAQICLRLTKLQKEKILAKASQVNMNITDYIRNYQVKGQISSELVKISREYFVLAALKYSFPERFSDLCKKVGMRSFQTKTGCGVQPVLCGFGMPYSSLALSP